MDFYKQKISAPFVFRCGFKILVLQNSAEEKFFLLVVVNYSYGFYLIKVCTVVAEHLPVFLVGSFL